MFYYLLYGDRSPPRPNPAGLRYSDEDICNNYNGAVSTDSTALTERAAELSESEVKSRIRLRQRCIHIIRQSFSIWDILIVAD